MIWHSLTCNALVGPALTRFTVELVSAKPLSLSCWLTLSSSSLISSKRLARSLPFLLGALDQIGADCLLLPPLAAGAGAERERAAEWLREVLGPEIDFMEDDVLLPIDMGCVLLLPAGTLAEPSQA